MNASDNHYKAYVYAINEQIAQHFNALDELSGLARQRPLTFNERSACERSLQVVVEAAIGCSKHYLKSTNKPVPAEARAAIERVYERLAITEPDISIMRGAIGMRNAIIHDYLNLDWQIIDPVLKEGKYQQVQGYIQKVTEQLLKANVQ